MSLICLSSVNVLAVLCRSVSSKSTWVRALAWTQQLPSTAATFTTTPLVGGTWARSDSLGLVVGECDTDGALELGVPELDLAGAEEVVVDDCPVAVVPGPLPPPRLSCQPASRTITTSATAIAADQFGPTRRSRAAVVSDSKTSVALGAESRG